MKICANDLELLIDEKQGEITSLKVKNTERCVCNSPIFVCRLRDLEGECHYLKSTEAKEIKLSENELLFSCFKGDFSQISIKIQISGGKKIAWQASVLGIPSGYAIEWLELPKIILPSLFDNNPLGGKILFDYNEGMIVTNESELPRYEAEFPSSGAYFMFPNMVASQFIAYLFEDAGLYIGAHDPARSLKGIDFCKVEGGVLLQMRLYSGCDFGSDFTMDYPIIWKATKSDWKSAAEIYRCWLDASLPKNVTKIKENNSLPEWSRGAPLIVTYPVRGVHDMDKMEPNELFPYTNALPILKKIKNATQCQIMALLMHWEGTAPWAPPYVWPPFGGTGLFNDFRDALHEGGDLLGVYCSGFGYTKQSTLIESYNCEKAIEERGVLRGVCHSPKNKPELGITCCPYQRYGYDICPASDVGKEILKEAYEPLFESGVDYAQILDQNHGGGQYLCYAREHDHPPMPGEWMTSNMQNFLSSWQSLAPNMLFGCESAAAEPFIGNLLMSDNRFELNYPFGEVVPLYSYLYHEYVRNFMGNQCGCPFEPAVDTLRHRLAYSFTNGDLMTLILAPSGKLMSHWGTHDFENAPDMEMALTFIKNMTELYKNGASKYLYGGKMAYAPDITCEEIKIPLFRGRKFATLPRLFSSVWYAENGKLAYIVVNPEKDAACFEIEGKSYSVDGLSGVIIEK